MKENNNPKEINTQKKDLWETYRSNSQFHYKDISNFNYEHRIRLNPLGESRYMDIRNQFPLTHNQDSLTKANYLAESNRNKHNSFDKAEIQSKINSQAKKQKYQTLLENDKHIENLCNIKNREIKSEMNTRKKLLKEKLTRIIKDALLFSKKNNPIKSMLPDNINEIIDKFQKQAQDASISLNLSNLSKISTIRADSKRTKNEFLSFLGVDFDNLNPENVNLDINKIWDFIVKIAKGRNVEDILRFKVVNSIMSITEKKASEKVRKIYEQMDKYNKYKEKKKKEENLKKQKEEQQKYQDMLKNNPKEIIRLKMIKSLSQPKLFNQNENLKKKANLNNKNKIKKKQLQKTKSAVFPNSKKNVIRFNAYNDVNKIIDFIDNSEKNSQNKFCKNHFLNIKMTKSMDANLKKMLKINEIKLKFK